MDDAILKNVLSLSNLAFCTYLPDYDTKQGLFSHNVIAECFQGASMFLPDADKEYYKSILVDSYRANKFVGDSIYYYDYVVNNNQSEISKGNSSKLVKATQAGKALSNPDEAAFGKTFFLLAMVASTTILLIGLFVYFMIV